MSCHNLQCCRDPMNFELKNNFANLKKENLHPIQVIKLLK